MPRHTKRDGEPVRLVLRERKGGSSLGVPAGERTRRRMPDGRGRREVTAASGTEAGKNRKEQS